MSSAARVAVIGDVGGHVDALRAELIRLGVPDDGAGALPDGLVVVQVGDLVHRGPDSEGVVELVGTHLGRTPDRWVQLIGNHEAFYIFGPQFRLRERLHRKSANALREWWAEGLLHAGFAFTTGGEQFLVTHAGLTRDYWRMFLGGPTTPPDAVQALDDMLRRADERLTRVGQVLGGPPDPAAGPLWAAADVELVDSWRGDRLPFSQLHGHSSLVDWPEGTLVRGDDAEDLVVDHDLRHTEVSLPGGRIIGIDPGHDDLAQASWGAWEAPLDDRSIDG